MVSSVGPAQKFISECTAAKIQCWPLLYALLLQAYHNWYERKMMTLCTGLSNATWIMNLICQRSEVAGVTFSDTDSAPLPKFLKFLQIWESDSCSNSSNQRCNRKSAMFIFKHPYTERLKMLQAGQLEISLQFFWLARRGDMRATSDPLERQVFF